MTVNILDGWFVDRAPGLAVVPSGAPSIPAGAGGKFYFEFTVGTVGGGQVTGAQIGFINATQRDTLPSELIIESAAGQHPIQGTPTGGRVIAQGRTANGAVVDYVANPSAWVCGTQILSPAVASGRWNTGDKIGVAIDTINNRWWSRNWTVTAGSTMTQLGTWEGSGNPVTPTSGWDISALTGNLFIWFGGTGRGTPDSATLNTGNTPFYGLDGTGVIPSGYVAWDATTTSHWDGSRAAATSLYGFYRDPLGVAAQIDADLRITISGMTATITNRPQALDTVLDNQWGSTWSAALNYPLGSVVVDAWQSFSVPSSFYYAPVIIPPSINQPVLNNTWSSAVIGVVSNSSKARI